MLKDFCGKEITVGADIVYPGRKSSSIWMNRAHVMSIEERASGNRLKVQQRSAYGGVTNTRPVTLTNLHNIVVLG